MWLLFAAGSSIFAGLTSILAKLGLKKVDSHLATALRTVVVLMFSFLMVLLTGGLADLPLAQGRTLLFLVLSGLATGASWLCYFRALQLGPVNGVVPVDKSSTILAMTLAFIFLGEPFGVMTVCAMTLMAAGTLLMIEKKKEEPGRGKAPRRVWLVYAVLSAVFAALVSLLAKVGMQGIDSNLGTALRTCFVLVFAWVLVFAQGRQKDIRGIDKRSWIFLVLSGLATGASWLCYFRALQDGPASIVVPIDKLSIFVTIAFARVVLGERLSRRSGLGLVCVVAGTLLLLV